MEVEMEARGKLTKDFASEEMVKCRREIIDLQSRIHDMQEELAMYHELYQDLKDILDSDDEE